MVRRRHCNNVFIKIILIIWIFCFLTFLIFLGYEVININMSKKNMILYLSQKDVNFDYRYDYVGVLEISSINLKRGYLGIDNKYNEVDENIKLIRDNEDSIVLASHNRGLYNGYFRNLDDMVIGDRIIIYDNYYEYIYLYVDNYDVMKTGVVDLFRIGESKNIFLITCKGDNMQTVYVGTLVEKIER